MDSKHNIFHDFKRAFKALSSRKGAQLLEDAETDDAASPPLQPVKEPPLPAQVLSDTLRSFAEADVACLAISHGGAVPPAVEQEVLQMIENHNTEVLRGPTNPKSFSSLQALDVFDSVFDGLGNLGSSRGFDVELDHSESQLSSEELLEERVRDCLRFLITGLGRQLSHCGLSAESKHHHVARLHLTGFKDQIDDQSRLFFDLYLSSRHDWTPCRWQDSRCIIQQIVPEAEKPGCGLIVHCEETKERLCILLEEGPEGRLLRQRDETVCRASISTPTVSLGKLLDNGSLKHHFVSFEDPNHLLPLDRANLCLNLALSLLQLSQDEWREIFWSPENIFFLRNPVSGVLQEKTKPYLAWTASSTPPEQDDSTDTDDSTCDAHLLHFARLLMEIQAGERIKTTARGLRLQSKLLKMIEDARIYLMPRDGMFVAAVKACLSAEGKMAASGESGTNEIRDFIYRNIVVNLDCSIARKGRPDSLSRSSMFSDQLAISSDNRAMIADYDGKFYETPMNINSARTARVFFNKMETWLERNILPLSTKRPPATNVYSKERIKIAIIDSGASRRDLRIRAAVQGGIIKEGRNFIPSAAPNDWDDGYGHGTIVTSLLLSQAPNAEIYVAKVTDGFRIGSNHLFCVGQAINWAIQKWQVDIISMSFVTDHEDEGIEEELAQAIDPSYEGPGISRKIVFAAAGNHGGNAPTGWPARRKGVIAIHATDGLGTPVNINTNPGQRGDNFATLGHDIETEWTPQGEECEKKIYVTGTSFATPIAAAIAANVLEFSRHKLSLTSDRKRTLYTGPCMRKIFREMVGNRGDYEYLQPWTLWEREEDICQVLLDCIAG